MTSPSVWYIFVQLKNRLDRGGRFQRGEHFRFAAFERAVVHDGDGRFDCLDQHRIVAQRQPVVRNLVNVDRADPVDWGGQIVLAIPSQIAGIEEFEVAKAHQQYDAVGIIGGIIGLGL